MALKDWKQIANNELFLIWKNNKIKQEITLFKKGGGLMGKNSLIIDDVDGTRMGIESKSFKTKSEAIKYARDYMRKN